MKLHKKNKSVYQDMNTSRNTKPVPSTSPWEDDSQGRQNEALVGVDEIKILNPKRDHHWFKWGKI